MFVDTCVSDAPFKPSQVGKWEDEKGPTQVYKPISTQAPVYDNQEEDID